MRFPSRTLSACALLLPLLACDGGGGGGGGEPSTPAGGETPAEAVTPDTPAPLPGFIGHDALVGRHALRFADPAEERRFDRARACFAARGAGDGWVHYPLRRIGNFVQEDWCVGEGAERGCAGGQLRGTAGSAWASVYTLHYEADWPQVFGLGVTAGRIPTDSPWGASFGYHANGASIVGEGLWVSYLRIADGRVAGSLDLGSQYVYDVDENRVAIAVPDGPEVELQRLALSPGSLRDTALTRLDALGAEAARAIEAGELTRCVYGEYQGDGIPPVCTPTPLTAAERAQWTADAAAEIADRKAAVERHHALFHALLVELIDLQRCW